MHAFAGENSRGFAMVTDVHINVDEPVRTRDFERILRHIESRDPGFVLNCGDFADIGASEEFEVYDSTVPDGLKDRMKEVPGNHEQQWIVDAFGAYDEHFSESSYSFDSGGLHVVGLDPLVMMEWGWYFDSDLLAWLERDLRQVPKGVPIILFLHFPMGAHWNYVHNDDDLLRVIAPYAVRGIFAGHAHLTEVTAYNGATQVVGRSLKNGPYYYWAERKNGGSGPVLEVTEVTVPADGPVQQKPLVVVPLSDPGPGGALGPLRTRATPSGGAVDMRVKLPRDAPVVEVRTRIHPHRYGRSTGGWSSLNGAGQEWTGRIEVSELPPGRHRMEVRAVGGDGAVYDDTVPFELPSPAARIAWKTGLEGRVQGALGRREGVVVAATTKGYVEAFAPSRGENLRLWRTAIGPVYRGPVFTPDGTDVLVPSADHHLYALDAASGSPQWSTDLGVPLAGDVALAEVDGETHVFLAAGKTLFSLDLDGRVLWSADLNGICAGRPECDGERVYVGSGDGNAYAFDARTGNWIWAVQLTNRTTTVGTVLYGPWACYVRLLPNGAVLFTTFTNAIALDGTTGERRWVGQGDELRTLQLLYTPPTLTDHGILLVDGFNGTTHVFDAGTGRQKWQAPALPRNFGAAPVPSPDDDSVYWLVGQSGLLVRIDLASQSVQQVLQVLTAYTQSTSALVGSGSDQVLVVGGQDGVLHGVVGLEEV
ncbi:MAG: PQQ-binding-like beta-propeller repeat protein [Actinomycetota bacterium]|nr:PQQ-binding-like beta-propeller repeat protein [Actinomycetota bacterium]